MATPKKTSIHEAITFNQYNIFIKKKIGGYSI